jgi:hypothetical protein
METAVYVEALRSDLEAAVAGDAAAEAIAERISRALEPSMQLRLLDVAGQAALELTEQLPAGHVEVRLAGRDVQLVYIGDESAPAPHPEHEGGTARLTLRMPETMKARVERAAAREGASTNAWLVRAVSRALDARPGKRATGRRLTGFAES